MIMKLFTKSKISPSILSSSSFSLLLQSNSEIKNTQATQSINHNIASQAMPFHLQVCSMSTARAQPSSLVRQITSHSHSSCRRRPQGHHCIEPVLGITTTAPSSPARAAPLQPAATESAPPLHSSQSISLSSWSLPRRRRLLLLRVPSHAEPPSISLTIPVLPIPMAEIKSYSRVS